VRRTALLLASLLLSGLLFAGQTPASASTTGACGTGLTLQLQPGLPGAVLQRWVAPAADIPAGPFYASLPVYPGARRLARVRDNPIWSYPVTPYLHSGVAEYRVSENPDDVSVWYSDTLAACGWKSDGAWTSNADVFPDGIVFVSRSNPHLNLQVQVGFGAATNGDTLIGYAVLDETLPPRPVASYLHGPFTRVNIAYGRSPFALPSQMAHIIHLSITDPATIRRLVRRINSLTDILAGLRSRPSGGDGPAWLTFVRPNGRHIGVFGTGLGLQVQHTRTLFDGDRVWPLISRLVKRCLTQHACLLSLTARDSTSYG